MKKLFFLFVLIVASCGRQQSEDVYADVVKDTVQIKEAETVYTGEEQIQTGNTTPQQLLDFAQTLIGTPYKYGSTDLAQGFDCSGFITYVFNHFDIAVPRSSAGFTNIQREITLAEAKPGDIILFTGTDSAIRAIGHMGIITSVNNNNIQFIHSSSGKANGVTITPFNDYYLGRFVKVLRIFKQNDKN